MKISYFSKADPIVSGEEIESVQINISKALPEMRADPPHKCETFHIRQAKRIAGLLEQSLPQGTFDRIIYELMRIKLKRRPAVYRGKEGT